MPLQYKLNDYKASIVQEASSGYVPVKMPKPLRSGAEVNQWIMMPQKCGDLLLDHSILMLNILRYVFNLQGGFCFVLST